MKTEHKISLIIEPLNNNNNNLKERERCLFQYKSRVKLKRIRLHFFFQTTEKHSARFSNTQMFRKREFYFNDTCYNHAHTITLISTNLCIIWNFPAAFLHCSVLGL